MIHFSVTCVLRTVVVLAAGAATLGPSSTLAHDAAAVRIIRDPASGHFDIVEAGKPVLRYNYHTVQPPKGFVNGVSPKSRKYAQPRSNYIHPLFGLDGETLTADWAKDHPHHRGIYWAWPEVDFRGRRADPYALQNVFARPTERVDLRSGNDWAEIEAENLWKWNDETPIVRETAAIRVWRVGEHGRFIDLTLNFHAIEDDVSLARRKLSNYGGLNIRLSPIKNFQVSTHTDAPDVKPQMSWGEVTGIWGDDLRAAGLAVFENPGNPEYPAQWVQYPALMWFQPTFPKADTRFILKKDRPLKLQYRLWVRRGEKPSDEVFGRQWQAYQQTNGALPANPTATSPLKKGTGSELR